MLRSINPYTKITVNEFPEYSEERIEECLAESVKSFDEWKGTGFAYRSSLMEKAAHLLRNNIKEYAGAITTEMGKPVKESLAEVEKCAWVCEYYASNAETFLHSEQVETDADLSYITYEPLGPVLGIMPWNFPFWQVFRFAIPTLMAGNTVLLKHASNVQFCAMHIENLFIEAGFPHRSISESCYRIRTGCQNNKAPCC